MIVIKIMGGLGNQMFQYALARKLQIIGRCIKLETSYYQDVPDGDTIRSKWLADFKHQFKETSIPSKWNFDAWLMKVKGENYILREKNYNYDSSILGIKCGYLIGYWQTEKYFADIASLIKLDFSFDINRITSEEEKVYQKIKQSPNSVSLHIRRGDYLNSANCNYFGNICTPVYYRKAIQYIKDRVGNCRFFIFTDSPEEVSTSIDLDENYYIVSNRQYSERFEMFLMSECKYHIIANSSFSWWGAWLDDRQDKIVITPEKWTGRNDREDIFCRDWIRISGDNEVL